MPSYSGKFDYLDENGGPLAQGPCELSFDEESCAVAPASGPGLAFDLGDVDRVAPGEWDLGLTLFPGRVLRLHHFGPPFSRMSQELLAAWRDRTVRCLLLEDLEEAARFDAAAATGDGPPARSEIRVFQTNIAVLPEFGLPIQWRLADVDAIDFDPRSYSVTLASGAERLVVSKAAKRTDELLAVLRETTANLRARSARALGRLFPFLNPSQLQAMSLAMPEGRSVPLGTLAAIHPRLAAAFEECAVDAALRPYFDALRARAGAAALCAGFKFIQKEVDAETEEAPGEAQPQPEESGEPPLFFWFFFPLADSNAAAWEACTGSGRATYFFRAAPPDASAIAALTRGLALVNFRREPIYLSDDSLERQSKFRRYAIGCRKLPALRALRAAMLGRALHSNLEDWRKQMEAAVR